MLSEDDIAATDNFFDVGGHSLMAATLVGELNNLGIGVAITDLYQHPSAAGLAALIQKATAPAEIENLSWRRGRTFKAGKIAIVGMAGEFPGASSVAALWENLKAKHDAVVRSLRTSSSSSFFWFFLPVSHVIFALYRAAHVA